MNDKEFIYNNINKKKSWITDFGIWLMLKGGWKKEQLVNMANDYAQGKTVKDVIEDNSDT